MVDKPGVVGHLSTRNHGLNNPAVSVFADLSADTRKVVVLPVELHDGEGDTPFLLQFCE